MLKASGNNLSDSETNFGCVDQNDHLPTSSKPIPLANPQTVHKQFPAFRPFECLMLRYPLPYVPHPI